MPITTPPAPASRISLIKGFLGIYLPLCVVFGLVGFIHYYSASTAEQQTREASEALNVDLARRMIASDIGNVVGDLMFLAEHVEHRGLVDQEQPDARHKLAIAEEFLAFASNKGLYDQIRYIDDSGMEVVRINYGGGKPRIVPPQLLQNKANRYYFHDALKQQRGQIYLSPLDLNIEEGRIEYPLKPVLRFATPVFDGDGRKRGIVLLNYFGSRMIDNFVQAAANIADHVELINQDGFWLSSPNPDNEWGFMFGRQTRFSARYPETWKRIVSQQGGQFLTTEGLFTFATIHPASVAQVSARSTTGKPRIVTNQPRFWKIVSHVSARELSATLPLFIRNNLTLYLSMLLLLTIAAWLLATSRHRHRLTEAQRDYEQRFRQTLENIDLAAVALSREGRVTFCNDYFLGMTGWHRNEVVGQLWLERFVPPEQHEEVAQIIHHMGDPERFPAHFENLVRASNGGSRLIAWNNTLSYDSQGQVIGVTGIGEDIKEQRRAEQELRKLSQAVEQSPSIVVITDKHGLIEYVNPKFTEVSGYSQAEVIGRNPRFLKSGETSETEYSELWRAVASGKEWRGEFHNRKKSGELYWEAASISAIRDADGAITHFLAVKEDITEHKRLQAEVEARNQELVRSQALAAMGRMASMIAHDLRNPLSSVKMTLQILGKGSSVEANRETLELCEISLGQIRYMEDILSDMLTYSRPDALKPEWITISKVIEVAVNLSQRRIEEHGVELSVHYHPGLPTLLGDVTKLRQVFANLISNAIQATEEQSRPRVVIDALMDLGPGGTGIRVDICDNGHGISEPEMKRVFEPFYTTRAKGTGLGLAIVKRILDQHQATIEVHPTRMGTCVSVVLPVSPTEVPTKTEFTEDE